MTETTDDQPVLQAHADDVSGRRKRMLVMPVLILCFAGMSWWWGASNAKETRSQVQQAVEQLVTSTLEQSATPTDGLRLRWGADALRSVFHASLEHVVAGGDWHVQIEPEPRNGLLDVRVVGANGTVMLQVLPVSGSDTATIRGVSTTPA